MKSKKIFIACDTKSIKKAKRIIKETRSNKIRVGYKFGLEFFNSKNGRSFISKIKNEILFLDLKLFDIPNTCVSAINAIKDLKINYLTIHISAGLKALKESKKVCGKTKLIGVTTLTSLDNKSLKQIGYNKNLNKLIMYQAKLAAKANLDALVCSPHEVKYIKKKFKKEIITPGIRFDSKHNDQKRVTTPKKAFQNGSDWLVIGRPITNGNIKNNFKKLLENIG